jgi:glycosyltransferase involved in cell wall biosynthesis
MMENKGKILVIIPAYNEEGSVGKVVEDIILPKNWTGV